VTIITIGGYIFNIVKRRRVNEKWNIVVNSIVNINSKSKRLMIIYCLKCLPKLGRHREFETKRILLLY